MVRMSTNKEVNKMKKMMQFEEAVMELILFGFDVVTTSGTEPHGNYIEQEGTQVFEPNLLSDTSVQW